MSGGLDARDVDRTYRRKMEAEASDEDHREYCWRVNGRAVLRTELSTPFRSLGASLVSHIARDQLLLPDGARQLRALVECTMTRDEWWEHVREQARGGRRRLL